ncbi:MAG TPA: hypothetical protein VMF35_14790 [Acidimicrobiales bacterium]|nr:hypothetical protein [Acidimicrobiales bacterium]
MAGWSTDIKVIDARPRGALPVRAAAVACGFVMAIALLVVAPAPPSSSAQTWNSTSTPLATISASAPGSLQQFGQVLAISADGTTAVVGGPAPEVGGPGTAYVVHAPSEGSWSNAYVVATLENPYAGPDPADFGSAVAISGDGDTVLVGDPQASSADGAAYVYHVNSESSWSGDVAPAVALVDDQGTSGDAFGFAVGLSSDGTTAFVSSPDAGDRLGDVQVFHASNADAWSGAPTAVATLTDAAESGTSSFGESIALSGDGSTALVGDSGMRSAYVFHTPNESSWSNTTSPTAALTPPNGTTAATFGASVALSSDGDTAAVGSRSEFPQGSVYVFHSSGEAQWVTSSEPAATLSDPNASGTIFGSAVAVSSNGATVLVGAEGAISAALADVYVTPSAASWSDTSSPAATLTDGLASGGAGFGVAAALSADGSTALIGNPVYNEDAGAIFAYASSQGVPPPPTTTSTTTTPPPPSHGYWLVGSDGGIFTFGSSTFYGSTGNLALQRPVVGIVPTADRGGYWLDASDGGVFAFGDTQFYGSIPGLGLNPAGSRLPNSLNAPIVGMVPSVDDRGYFMVASDGGVFAFGDARFAGSCPGIGGCAGSAVAVMPDHSGNGYWLVTSTGNVYTFGDAPYFGAPERGTVTSALATPDGQGYWVLLADGEVLSYGDAARLGSPSSANFGPFDPATSIFATSDGQGYWVSSALGRVFPFGDAPGDGDMSGTHLNGSIIAGSGY